MAAAPVCINLGVTRLYLLPCNGGYLLVDTSYARTWPKFMAGLRAHGISLDQIRWVFLTHTHEDHTGFLARLLAASGAHLIAHANAVQPLREGVAAHVPVQVSVRSMLPVWWLLLLLRRDGGYAPYALTAQDVVIAGDDAQALPALGLAGQVLYTPGHTHEAISLLLPDGSAFVGDAASNLLHWAGLAYRPIVQQDEAVVRASWRKLLAAGARQIYPAHGAPFSADRLR